jgi:uncharacterized protein (DUF169 family)
LQNILSDKHFHRTDWSEERYSKMTRIQELYKNMIDAMNVEGLEIPIANVKFYKQGETIPQAVTDCVPDGITLTSCQSTRQAGFGDSVLLTAESIGCVAAAITFGLVDQHQDSPMGDSLVYTDVMKGQSGMGEKFQPPTPEDFTSGTVYACTAAGRPDFALFGTDDTGRFESKETAKQAISDMMAIQPPTTQGVFIYAKEFDDVDLVPDVVILSVRPVELTRIIQAYQFQTGKRVTSSMGGLRVVNSDLMVRPYLTQEMNISTYCLGARLIGQFEGERMGSGRPFGQFEEVVAGMKLSQGGFPFQMYPGAADSVHA